MRLGSYPSIYGTLALCAGTELTWTVRGTRPTGRWTSAGSTRTTKAELTTPGRAPTWPPPPAFPADTYFGGKALYRGAMLYQLAAQLGADDAAAAIKAELTETLGQWTEPTGCDERDAFCFVYDDAGQGRSSGSPRRSARTSSTTTTSTTATSCTPRGCWPRTTRRWPTGSRR